MTADTNIFVYVVDDQDSAKQSVARLVVGALMQRDAQIALQCVGEYQNVLRRKLKRPPWEVAQDARNLMASFSTFLASETAALAALTAMAAGEGSYWDRLLLYSASEAGQTVLFTEDMQSGARIAGVEIVNPFTLAGDISLRARELLEL